MRNVLEWGSGNMVVGERGTAQEESEPSWPNEATAVTHDRKQQSDLGVSGTVDG